MRSFCTLIFLSFYIVTWLPSQHVIDIEIDSIHCQDGSCYLLNFSGKEVYDCEIVSHELARDRYSYAIDCMSGGPAGISKVKENDLDLQIIEDPDNFLNWAKKKRFYTTYQINKQQRITLFQPLSKGYFSKSSRKAVNEYI